MATLILRASKGSPLTLAEVDQNFINLNADVIAIVSGGILTDASIAANAGIADTKLSTIVTAGKVANSATTATDSNTPGAIVSRDGSGSFSAGAVTLGGNPSTSLQAAPKQYVDAAGAALVQVSTPPGAGYPVGKLWLQNDLNRTLSAWDGLAWLGIASGGTFTLQPTVIYVDAVNGSDLNDGHRIINPMKTIKAAVASASAGDIVRVAPGVYQETLPIDITVDNLSIAGDAQRSCFVHPTAATETNIMFRCNSGTYIDGFTFVGLKASGARGGHPIDSSATYGLPAAQGWVAGFYPGCVIKKSPFINNCSNFADSAIDNSNFNPNNYSGTGGDVTSAPTGGGVIVDGSLPAVNSPLRSFVINEFTQVCLDGPGLLVCNNGYAQAVSFFGIFCHYHAKALSGGQINMEVGTTDFGRYGLIADGKSGSAIFSATADGAASGGAAQFNINAPVAAQGWFGSATRPGINMLVQIGANIYPITSSVATGNGWTVYISRPDPNNAANNLGLISGHANGAAVDFYLRSMISTASHTMEYAGSGTDYTALPENGGAPIEANEAVNLNNGKVWLTSTDQSGKFKVGDLLQVDQQTGAISISASAYAPNIVLDQTPELGGNLDVLSRNIYSSVGNVRINDNLEVTGLVSTPGAGPVTIDDDLLLSGSSGRKLSFQLTGGSSPLEAIWLPGHGQGPESSYLYIRDRASVYGASPDIFMENAPVGQAHQWRLSAGAAFSNNLVLLYNGGSRIRWNNSAPYQTIIEDNELFVGPIQSGTGLRTGVIYTGSISINGDLVVNTTTGTKIGTATGQKLGFFGVTPVVQQSELTDELTTVTHTAPGTPDYAIQNLVQNTGFGFVTADEGNTVLSVIANLQTRVNELETKLVALGFLADAD
ncbi:MAG: DUF1565 domain-containing protein [Cyanobacteriota bacterium]|nr:DUF1565 domain-containing protein [Cyanobacteriota bacterium]